MNSKVRCVVALQLIAFLPQLLAIPDAGFPSVLFLTIYIEINVFPVLTLAVGPVIIRIYFRIQGKLCKQEVCDRACHTSVIVPLLVGMLVGELWGNILQLVNNKLEYLTSFALRYLLQFHVV